MQIKVGDSATAGSIGKFDGITGQFQTLYTGNTTGALAVATDGTIFTTESRERTNTDPGLLSVNGIDPATGGTKFSVPIPQSVGSANRTAGRASSTDPLNNLEDKRIARTRRMLRAAADTK